MDGPCQSGRCAGSAELAGVEQFGARCRFDRRAPRKPRTGIQYRIGNPVSLSVEGATGLPSRANRSLFALIAPFGTEVSECLPFYINLCHPRAVAARAQGDGQTTDQQLAHAVRVAEARSGVGMSHVSVFAHSGQITLVGWVPEREHVARAKQSAMSVLCRRGGQPALPRWRLVERRLTSNRIAAR
ncbi:hypothetical protein LMG27952_05263 [Paraburkholderia hiiakae]|uniref:BON domain-containing protein n=1 Tax=Paraburkholderia hiiakae TaxID=1081782 RepID=A0ABN7I870_9BURK|nr:hypothetical protein LMG27952_05263 [Paraburkholderia hiiakae]